MFSDLDSIIFPDSCEVIEVVPSQHYVYPIFKNGSSSLKLTAESKGWQSIYNQDLGNIDTPITVYLREPHDRFIRGVNTYVQQLIISNPVLDVDTVLFFVQQYLFLNRHYAPQLFWLLNLARYTDGPILLADTKEIKNLTDITIKSIIENPNPIILDKVNQLDLRELELYFFLDNYVLGYIGQEITVKKLLRHLKADYPEIYRTVFEKTLTFANVLPKT